MAVSYRGGIYVELLALLAIAIGTFLTFSLAVVGLLETPWPILTGGMLLTFLGLQRLSVFNQLEEETVSKEETQLKPGTTSQSEASLTTDKDLMYRGIPYNSQDSLSQRTDSQPRAIKGTYRGHPWQRSHSAPSVTPQCESEMIYRGQKVRRPKSEERPPS
ncbi:MAG TPA: DUF4278 domain-containing protein [Trichocoleus sp.]